jgi:hypothetical protein
MKTKALLSGISMAAVFALAGCTPDDQKCGPTFFPDDEAKAVQNLTDAQASNAAIADPTLYACHFDGTKLNTLGQAKLDLLMNGLDNNQPMKVYIDVAESDGGAAEESVVKYLHRHGVAADRITIATGPNPTAGSLATEQMSRLKKTESNDTSGSGSSSTSTGGASTAGAPGSN